MLATNFRCLIFSLIFPVASLGLFATSSQANTESVPEAIKQKALQLVQLRRGGSPTNLSVVSAVKANYRLLGKNTFEIKVRDASGSLSGITLDGTGRELSSAQLRSAEQAAYKSRFGTLDQNLAQKLVNARSEQQIRVAIWLKAPSSAQIQRPAANSRSATVSQAQASALSEQVNAQRAAEIKPVVTSVVNRLKTLDSKVTSEQYSPLVYAKLSPQIIRQIAQWSEVLQVSEAPILKPTLEVARPTIAADVVQGRGIFGTGVQVAEIEVGGQINTSNPFLAGITQDTTYSCLAAHAAAVAGDIRSTDLTNRGIAPSVALWIGGSCGGWDNELTNRSTAAADWGARVFNLSLGGDSGRQVDTFARYYDDLVINRFRTVVVAAGNSGNGGNVLTPAVAYNIITVGSFDDRNTTNWNDDVISSFSSGLGPISTHGDRLKPEVAAPGQNITSTINSAPWIGSTGSGTSYASPMVAGEAALLINRNSSLSYWPEAVKAIIMTTAVHNITGDARLSTLDGAGGVAADRADDIAHGVGGSWGAQNYGCDASTPLEVATISLNANQRTRATIAWDNNPDYSDYVNRPSADLDLQVVDPSGIVVAGSYSFDNTYEIVDFTPSISGTYKLRVNKFRCDLTPKWLGWAWRQGN